MYRTLRFPYRPWRAHLPLTAADGGLFMRGTAGPACRAEMEVIQHIYRASESITGLSVNQIAGWYDRSRKSGNEEKWIPSVVRRSNSSV